MDADEALHKLQAEELDILLTLDRFCRANSISWFLDSGTALGAIRHQGFIPWDDDVDIAMLRPDYERFLKLAQEGLPKGYSLHTFEDTPGFAGFFAKVYRDGTRFETAETAEAACPQGIFVDIFCYERLARDSEARARQIRNALWSQRLSYLYHARSITVPHHGALGTVERAGCAVAHGFVKVFVGPSRTRLLGRFERSLIRDEALLSDDVISLVWPYTGPIPVELLSPVTFASFEGHRLPVPGKCERYLELLYGNWRELPAPDDRHTHLPLRIDFGDGTVWRRGD